MALRYGISGPRSSSSSILGRNWSVSRPRDLTTMGLTHLYPLVLTSYDVLIIWPNTPFFFKLFNPTFSFNLFYETTVGIPT
ncbi:unnamed protein product [Brassica oleracea var. botrytis]